MGSTLKVRPPEAKTLIDKIKAEIKKRAELKAQRMLLKNPKGSRSTSRSTEVELEVSTVERRLQERESPCFRDRACDAHTPQAEALVQGSVARA